MKNKPLIALLTCSAILAAPVWAQVLPDPYRLTPGDRIEVTFVDATQSVQSQVDIDGNIRLIEVGAVRVSGMTIDEAEEAIEAKIAAAGLYVDPDASLALQAYAPIVVAGDIRAPGRIDYVPGMTVATALGISGGTSVSGVDRYDIERARVETRLRLQEINLEIASHAVKIARLEALLAETDKLTLPAPLKLRIPSAEAVDLERLLQAQTQILTAELQERADLLALWDAEIAAGEQQKALIDERIAVQRGVVEQAALDLANMRNLSEGGLATGNRLIAASQRDAEARARLLELETAKVGLDRLIAETRRNRTAFVLGRTVEVHAELNDAELAMDRAILQYGRYLEQQTLLSGSVVTALVGSQIVEVDFAIISPRDNRLPEHAISLQTPLLPGDTLVVTVQAAALPPDDT